MDKNQIRQAVMGELEASGIIDNYDVANRIAEKIIELSKPIPPIMPLEWQIAKEGEVILDDLAKRKKITDEFERVLKFNPLPWGTSAAWERLERFLVKEYQKNPGCFQKFQSWRENEGKFEAPFNKQIYDNPDRLIACWPKEKAELRGNDVSRKVEAFLHGK